MSYTIWIKIENDDGQPGDDDEGWASIASADTRDEAVSIADNIISHVEASGRIVERLDGWWQDDEHA